MRLILLITTLLVAPTHSQSLTVGSPFPHIPLPDIGRTAEKDLKTIADFSGQKTVVHLFASW